MSDPQNPAEPRPKFRPSATSDADDTITSDPPEPESNQTSDSSKSSRSSSEAPASGRNGVDAPGTVVGRSAFNRDPRQPRATGPSRRPAGTAPNQAGPSRPAPGQATSALRSRREPGLETPKTASPDLPKSPGIPVTETSEFETAPSGYDPRDPRTSDSGGDTVRLRSVDPARTRTSAGFGRSTATPVPTAARSGPSAPRPGRGTNRPAPLPKRAPQHVPRFGFFGFLIGLIGLLLRMIILTALVGGMAAGIAYYGIQTFIRTEQQMVPDVRGRKIDQAFELLSDKGFPVIRDRAEPSAIIAPGEVIEQRPAPGTQAKEGMTVRLVVSSGRAAYVVPEVRGETRENALNKIRGARLEVGNIAFHEDDKTMKDTVISQSPEPNKGLDQPARVDLLISSGPRGSSLTMPDVTARSVADAKATLEARGIRDVTVDPPDAAQTATVVSQDPLVGKTILQSERVTLSARRQ